MKLGRAAPSFSASNLDDAILFWEQLGFEVTFTNGNPICFAIVKRDDCEVHLCQDDTRVGKGHCHILVEGLEALAADFQGKVLQPPKLQKWGMRDMVIADADGNTVELAERMKPGA